MPTVCNNYIVCEYCSHSTIETTCLEILNFLNPYIGITDPMEMIFSVSLQFLIIYT